MAKLAYTVAKALSLEPQNKDYQRGQILTTADAGHYDTALFKLKQLKSGAPDKANLLAEAYIYKLTGVIRMNYGR